MRIALALMLVGLIGPCWAVDDRALWLPVSYSALYPKLMAAAKEVEAMEICVKVIRGSLHSSSTSEHDARFSLVCRGADHKTFPVMVDAVSGEKTLPVVVTVEHPEAEAPPQRGSAQYIAWVASHWSECESIFKQKSATMLGVKQITLRPPLPQLDDEGGVSIQLDFDAQDLQGRPLAYRMECYAASPEAEVTAKITARR